jgi:hypothetical protein
VTLSSLFVLRSQLGQNLLIAGLPAGDSVKVSAGIFADCHTLSSKCPADVAEVTLMLSRIEFIFLSTVFLEISLPISIIHPTI